MQLNQQDRTMDLEVMSQNQVQDQDVKVLMDIMV